jgi:murein DD-endopeptidase MepM/ murein hydrolase activator NlpD
MTRRVSFILLAVLLSGCWTSNTLAPVTRYGQLQGAGTTGAHTVAAGDTVWNIAQRYRLVMRDIIIVNKLEAPYALQAGQRLILPPPRNYTVRAGDSLYTVSRMFNTSPAQLAQLNDLRAPYALRRGQVLKLPAVADPLEKARLQQAAAMPPVPAIKPATVERETLAAPAAAPAPTVTGISIPAPAPQLANATLSAKVPKTTPPRAGAKFMRPVAGPVLSSYGPKSGGLHNDGVNIKAPRGAPVRAAENGVVVYAESMRGYGNIILIRHADRWMTAYAHLDGFQVKRGDTVKQGQTIGTVGSTGAVSEPQLHFEIRRGTEALNPEKYM